MFMISEWTLWPSAQPWGINWLVCPSAWPRPPSKCFHCLSVRPSVSLTETPVCNQRRHISFGRPTHSLVAAQQRPWQIGSDAVASTSVVSSRSTTEPADCYPNKNRPDKHTAGWSFTLSPHHMIWPASGRTCVHAQIHFMRGRDWVSTCHH